MTHDELVRFAAGKVGGHVLGHGVFLDSVRYTIHSPDLMLKGMEVCPHEISIHVSPEGRARYIYFHSMETWDERMTFYDKAANLPLTFWAAWYKLEKGES